MLHARSPLRAEADKQTKNKQTIKQSKKNKNKTKKNESIMRKEDNT